MKSLYEIHACWIYDSQIKRRCNIQSQNLDDSGWVEENVWKYFAVIVTHRSYTKCPTPCHGSVCELWYVHVKNNKPKKTLSVETQKKIVIWFLVYKNLWSHSHRGLQNAVIPKGHSWVSISISIFTYSREKKIYIYIHTYKHTHIYMK